MCRNQGKGGHLFKESRDEGSRGMERVGKGVGIM
jgi:hypothetical protein